MKKNNLVLYVLLLIAMLSIVLGVFYLYISDSRIIEVFGKGIAERDAMINERDNVIAGLRLEITDLNSAKSFLAGYLDNETLAKAAISGNLNTLEVKFRDATRESMRIEGQLTGRLNWAIIEAESLKVKLDNEGVAKKLLTSQYQEDKHKTTEVIMDLLEMYGASLNDVEYEKEKNKEQKEALVIMEGRLEIAQKLVENVLTQEVRPATIKISKTVKTAIFIPADIKLSIADIDRYRVAAGRSLRLNQLWFFGQLGETFSATEPVIFLGKKKLAEYDKLSAGERIIEVRKEMNVSWKEIFIILLVGSGDRFNYGSEFPPTALITGESTNQILEGHNGGAAVVAHELGHVWGLPHLVSNDRTLVMMVISNGYAPALNFFPFAKFTEQEKNILRSNLAK